MKATAAALCAVLTALPLTAGAESPSRAEQVQERREALREHRDERQERRFENREARENLRQDQADAIREERRARVIEHHQQRQTDAPN